MSFDVVPMPEMVSQRLLPAFMPTLPIIDPTCGRYCLKALLKHHYERVTGQAATDIDLPKPKSTLSHWIGYDPYSDFQLGSEVLMTRRSLPASLDGWEGLLRVVGPIILAGVLGQASVPHFILLVGVDTDANTFRFKDPLAGDVIGEEAYATMLPRINNRLIFAATELDALIAQHTELRAENVVGLVFDG